MIFLTTRRLILRKFREEDFPAFWRYANDPEMSRMMGRRDMSDPEDARMNFDWLLNREERGYCLVLKQTGEVIGNLTVGKVPDTIAAHPELTGKRGCSLSFSISRTYQRRGLMFEAVSALLNQLLWYEDMDYVNCGHFNFNEASRRLQEKLGFSPLFSETLRCGDEELTSVESVIFRQRYRMEHSCGAVVFTREDGKLRYVVERMRGGHHGFPKGHMEPGETEEETALREIREEVGLRPALLPGFREEITYTLYELDNTAKTVTYFLGEYENQPIRIQEEELLDAKLMTYSQAMETLEYEDEKAVLTKANNFLEKG